MEGARERPQRPPDSAIQVERNAERQALNDVARLSEEAHLYVEQGLSCDESGQTEQAKTLYEKGLRCILEALSYSIDPSDPQSCALKNRQEKMRKMQRKLQTRLEEMIRTDPDVARAINDPPPTYERATSPQDDNPTGFVMVDRNEAVDASTLYSIDDGVQIFFISADGYVSAPSYPSMLTIIRFTDENAGGERPPAFLRVGSWNYPLHPGCSPVLEADWGAYVFPDTETEGASVGLIIPDTVPQHKREIFEGIMKDLTAYNRQSQRRGSQVHPTVPPRPAELPAYRFPYDSSVATSEDAENRTSRKISRGIDTVTDWITWGLEKGAEKGSVYLKAGSNKLRNQLQPDKEHAKISSDAQKGVEILRNSTHAAVKVSKFVVDKLGEATLHIAREAVPHIKKHGQKYLPESATKKREGRSKVDDVVEVAASGLKGFGTMYMGLENAARVLAKSIADETVHTVTHKYGPEAGKFAENSVFAAGNLGMTVYNANHLGVKAIAKRAAKDTGIAMLEDAAGKELVGPSTSKTLGSSSVSKKESRKGDDSEQPGTSTQK